MRKTLLFLAAAVLCLSARAQVGPADPGVYVFVAPPVGPTPVEQWLMNEGSGDTFFTSSSSGNNITASNITWASVTGFPGLVPVFNGSNSSGIGANQTNTNFTGTTPFSVSLWALITAFQAPNEGGGTFITTFQGGNLTGWEVGINGTGNNPQLFNMDLINNLGGGGNIQVAATAQPSTGVIHHFVATYDGSQTAAGITLYIDGVAQAVTIDGTSFTGAIANTEPVNIGARLTNGTAPFDGSMADLRIYNVQLTSTEVTAIFDAGPQ
jgi:hypothetical protein